VVLADGRAVVGDLAMNGPPSSPFRPTPPIVAQDPDLVVASWRLIHDRGAVLVYPGHGAPFAWDNLEMRL
jgi:glyoxylase-like metal-dependent hydrolase (beta-lactamase superfamily II)